MKLISIGLGVTALTVLAGCAPQRRPVGFPTTINTTQKLSVPINGELRVGFYTGIIRDDCTSVGHATVRPTVEPVNGRIHIRQAQDVPHLVAAPGTPRSKCAGRTYSGTLVTYQPTAGFAGEDKFGIDVIWPSGVSLKRTITVQVR